MYCLVECHRVREWNGHAASSRTNAYTLCFDVFLEKKQRIGLKFVRDLRSIDIACRRQSCRELLSQSVENVFLHKVSSELLELLEFFTRYSVDYGGLKCFLFTFFSKSKRWIGLTFYVVRVGLSQCCQTYFARNGWFSNSVLRWVQWKKTKLTYKPNAK